MSKKRPSLKGKGVDIFFSEEETPSVEQQDESPKTQDTITPANQQNIETAPGKATFYLSASPLMSLDVAVLVRMIETLQQELEAARKEKSRMLDLLQDEQRYRHMLEAGRTKRWESVWPRLKTWLQGMYPTREG